MNIIADMLTRPLVGARFRKLRDMRVVNVDADAMTFMRSVEIPNISV